LATLLISQDRFFYTGAKTPDGELYTGTLQDYLARYGTPEGGGGQAAPQGKPRVFSNVAAIPADLKVGDIVNGKEYIGGSGDKPFNNPNNWVTPKKGGQTGAPSGNF
jgi:hypothetical protein